eukprot:SM000373S13610  [mRNA]  locus=s373:7134:18111:+ [translate_table: standard]
MRARTVQILWHDKDPVLSLDFHASGLLATAGADKDIKLWELGVDKEGLPTASYLSSLSHHSYAVNVIRFSPAGGEILLWKSITISNVPSWKVLRTLSRHEKDVLDLQWSSDGQLLASGSVDNTCIVWDHFLQDHVHYVQGLAWDPLGQFLATQSSDRTCRIYLASRVAPLTTKNRVTAAPDAYSCRHVISKRSFASEALCLPTPKTSGAAPTAKVSTKHHLMLDETLPSFYRRLAWSPDGSFLVIPAGMYKRSADSPALNTAYAFSRRDWSRPSFLLPSPGKAVVAVRFCPVFFRPSVSPLKGEDATISGSAFKLPYKLVYAIASLNSVYLYNTEHLQPVVVLGGIHYAAVTDIAWSQDARFLAVSSQDGYCTIVSFEAGELGTPLALADLPSHIAEVQPRLEGATSSVTGEAEGGVQRGGRRQRAAPPPRPSPAGLDETQFYEAANGGDSVLAASGRAAARPYAGDEAEGPLVAAATPAADGGGAALEVTVTDPVKQGDGVQAYISYLVSYKTDMEEYQWKAASVIRRFSDFVWLHDRLAEKNRGTIIPPLPEKNVVAGGWHRHVRCDAEKFRFSADFIEGRRRALDAFMGRLAAHPRLRRSPDLQLFLQASEDVWAMETSRGPDAGSSSGLFKKKPGDFVQLFKDMQVKVSSVVLGKERGAGEEEVDVELEALRDDVLLLESNMQEAQKQAMRLVKRQRGSPCQPLCHVAGSQQLQGCPNWPAGVCTELGQSLTDFGVAVIMLGNTEGGALGRAFAELGNRSDMLATRSQKQASDLLLSFEEPLKEYTRIVQSIKGVHSQPFLRAIHSFARPIILGCSWAGASGALLTHIKVPLLSLTWPDTAGAMAAFAWRSTLQSVVADRTLALRQRQELVTELEAKRGKLIKLKEAQPPLRPGRIHEGEAEVDEALRRLQGAREQYEEMRVEMGAEMARFQKERVRDLNRVLHDFAVAQAQAAADSAATWRSLLPAVEAAAPPPPQSSQSPQPPAQPAVPAQS